MKKYFLQLVIILLFTGCKIEYSLNGGGTVDERIKTATIEIFENQAPLTNPNFSRIITEALRNKFISQTKLKLVNEGGDINFKGYITGYSTSPVAVSGDQTASLTRLTITINVEYVNKIDDTQSFTQAFSRFADFNSTQNLSQVEDQLMNELSTQLVQDVFNKAFLNW